ncbi:hypothetical protein M409DRAFT_56119 [Zasmidium cellare ATCC 36951]|uniref:Zn(2)-C6 fungal-type domain-containing protein n=1 Tax=Zasmidium cellare ATCC 36951 TaxID=1080233 RepID=A0A6A6CDF9_ZASCE|nr:uncharacterized protein M409DRAFT_56119 [Zasmidium cellare ATCC 36951]KAF2165247.1 hypothetical protein M409DRAFT_56119 [Zasmidium cellare ATCC 36951]
MASSCQDKDIHSRRVSHAMGASRKSSSPGVARASQSPEEEVDTVLRSLPSCDRCRTSKKRCDTQLPACSNCARFNVDCIFYDHVAKEKVSRSYILELVQRLHQLKNGDVDWRSESSLNTPHPAYHFTNVRNAYRLIGLHAPLFTKTSSHHPSESKQFQGQDRSYPPLEPPNGLAISSELHYFLVENYMEKCNTVYPILEAGRTVLQQDPSQSNSISPWTYFVLNMSCYRAAQTCFESVMSELDVEALQAVLLLALYSLFDPQQGNIGQQIAFAHRLEIELAEREADSLDGLDSSLGRLRKVIFYLGTQVSSVLERSVGFHSMISLISHDKEKRTVLNIADQSDDHVYSLFALQASARNETNDDPTSKFELLRLPRSPLAQVATDETLFLIKGDAASATRLINAYTSDETVYTILTSHLAFKAATILLSSSEPLERQRGYAKGPQILDRCTLKWPNAQALYDVVQKSSLTEK